MTHPKVLVDIDGVPVSGLFFERLISLNITDREGMRSRSQHKCGHRLRCRSSLEWAQTGHPRILVRENRENEL